MVIWYFNIQKFFDFTIEIFKAEKCWTNDAESSLCYVKKRSIFFQTRFIKEFVIDKNDLSRLQLQRFRDFENFYRVIFSVASSCISYRFYLISNLALSAEYGDRMRLALRQQQAIYQRLAVPPGSLDEFSLRRLSLPGWTSIMCKSYSTLPSNIRICTVLWGNSYSLISRILFLHLISSSLICDTVKDVSANFESGGAGEP